MKRISIQELRPGTSLPEPIYTRDRKLLLARGLPFTEDMRDSLRGGAWKFVFVGEWNDSEAARYDAATPLQSFRAEAERMGDALLRTFQADLATSDPALPPIGPPIEDAIDRNPKPRRPKKVRDEFASTRGAAAALVEGVSEGLVPPSEVAGAADSIIETIVSQLCGDPSLAANFVNLKGVGEYLYTHSLNRAVLSLHIGAGMGYSRKQIVEIAIAALIADLGMNMVPQGLVNAPRRLTANEYAEIQRHALYSLHAAQKMSGLPPIARFAAYQHHERYDGSGYPGRRKTGMIHRAAAIVAVADAYDAMTSPRPWRAAMPQYVALETLIKEASRGKYDRDAVRALLHYISLFPIGSLVRLNTGAVGKVVHATGPTYDRPIVALMYDRTGARRLEGETINLADHRELKVDSFVDGSMGVPHEEGF